jgi:hypothetical protein
MKIFVSVKPGAKEEKVLRLDEAHFKISVKEPPVDGRANWAVIRTLADYLKKPATSLRIISGQTSRQKILEIL